MAGCQWGKMHRLPNKPGRQMGFARTVLADTALPLNQNIQKGSRPLACMSSTAVTERVVSHCLNMSIFSPFRVRRVDSQNLIYFLQQLALVKTSYGTFIASCLWRCCISNKELCIKENKMFLLPKWEYQEHPPGSATLLPASWECKVTYPLWSLHGATGDGLRGVHVLYFPGCSVRIPLVP